MSAKSRFVVLLCSTAIVTGSLHEAHGASGTSSDPWSPGSLRVAGLGALTKRSMNANDNSPREPSLAEQFAEADAEARHAKDTGEKAALEKKREEIGHRWLDGLAESFEVALRQHDSTEARLIVTSVFELMNEHPSLGSERARFETLFVKAIPGELAQAERDSQEGFHLRALERVRAVKAVAPNHADVRKALVAIESKAQAHFQSRIDAARLAKLSGAELFASRLFSVAGGSTATYALDEQLTLEVSRKAKLTLVGNPCSIIPIHRLLLGKGTDLEIELEVELCAFQEARREGTEEYTYETTVSQAVQVESGANVSYSTSRSFERDPISGRSGWVERRVEQRTPTYKTEHVMTAVERKGTRLVKHVVTSLALRGLARSKETSYAIPFEVKDSFDDQQYDAPGGKRNFSGEGPALLAARAGEVVGKAVELVLHDAVVRRGKREFERAEKACAKGQILECEDALVLAQQGHSRASDAQLAVIEQRELVTKAQAAHLLSSNLGVPKSLTESPRASVVSPKVHWTQKREAELNERAMTRPMHVEFRAAYGRPNTGEEFGRIGLTAGAWVMLPIEHPVFPSVVAEYRIGFDHGPSFIYDVQGGFGAASRLGPLALSINGVVGSDRYSLGDGYEVPAAFTYGANGHFGLEFTKRTSLIARGYWLKRHKGPDNARVEKRLAAMLMWLDDEVQPGKKSLKATHVGAAIEDYGFGRAYILLFGD